MQWRFAQLSDVRLGARLTQLDAELASALRDASRQALRDGFKLAQDQGCEGVLVPGDLFVLKGIDPQAQLRFVYDCMADFPGLQFFIVPGHGDALAENGPYIYTKPPSNAHLFISDEWTTIDLENVTITARAHTIGEGQRPLDWDELPRPNPDKLSVLMLRGALTGAADGRSRQNSLAPIDPERLLGCRYDYAALGGLHARIELRRDDDKAAAAYAGPPQCLDWESRGPGGMLIGTLGRAGAELEFHSMAVHRFQRREAELPLPWVESYRTQLDTVLESIDTGFGAADICRLLVSGELHQNHREELERRVAAAEEQAFHCEVDTSRVEYFSGPDPAELVHDSLLASFLQRCAAEAQPGADPEVYLLARRLGWLLFTSKGLPAEITE
jgi:DNA repair exonuclease SbcCD nuclease subunit